jgi:hypothetical protein
MKRWEYLVLEQSTHAKPWLPDYYGQQGWELVSVVRVDGLVDRLWFKRPLRAKPAPKRTAKRRARS